MNVTEKKKDQITSALIQVVCVILGLIIMAPVLYCIAAAFMKPTEILSSNPSLFPSGFYLDNFIQALKMTQIPRFLVNSLFVSLVCSVMRMITSFWDPNGFEDIQNEVCRLIPTRIDFKHQHDTPTDAAGHVKSTLIGVDLPLIIHDGKLLLGSSQGIYFLEFDGPRKRSFYVQVMGE